MDGQQGLLIGIALAAISGVPGLLFSRQSLLGQWISVLLAVAGCGYGLLGVGRFLMTGVSPPGFSIQSPIQGIRAVYGIDALSAVFLVPIFVVGMMGTIYGLGYWKQTEHPENGRKLRLFYGLVIAGMASLVMARNGVTFLFGWEVMAVSAFFLVSTDDHDDEVREAGWLYIASSHSATLCLFCLFPLMASVAGTFDFVPLTEASPRMAMGIFLLALAGFGTKAGLMPLHFWLPSSHAMAPSHVSALMSGVIIKMGVYGFIRTLSLLPDPPIWWGGLLLTMGAISAILGMAFAIAQQDLKRLLAYSSVENIGIIFMGIGLAMLGRALNQPTWILLGMAGALLHVWNHSFFKALMFMGAGSIIHAVHTRRLDRMGGLLKSMPSTGLLFLIGAVAVCGLPPLNGFVSEFLIYLGLFSTLGIGGGAEWDGAAFAVPALALTGALAVACFVRLYGAVFLGVSRSDAAQRAHESPASMLLPMTFLAALCGAIGVASDRIAPFFNDAVSVWHRLPNEDGKMLLDLAPLGWISTLGLAFLGALAIAGVALWLRLKTAPIGSTVTWDCGYAAPTRRMQYTASSLSQMLAELFGWALRWRGPPPKIDTLFPASAEFHTQVDETVLDNVVMPTTRAVARVFDVSRWLQQGSVQAYLLYIFAVLVVLLLTV